MASKKKRLAEKIAKRVSELNKLMMEAHNQYGLEVEAILDCKLLKFPVLSVRLLKEV